MTREKNSKATKKHDKGVAAKNKSAVGCLGEPDEEVDNILALQATTQDKRFRLPNNEYIDPMLPAEIQALEDVGVLIQASEERKDPDLMSITHLRRIEATALSISEVALRLGVTDSTLRRRITKGSLISISKSNGRNHLIPAFQVNESGELPGLRKVLSVIRPSANPIVICGFFTTPQPDLEGEAGEAMTPVEWLLKGGDIKLVTELAAEI